MIYSIIIFWVSLILLGLMLLFAFNIIFSVLSFAPWVPSRSRDLARIFKLASLKDGQLFYDLGAGDGKIVFYAGQHYNVKAIGLEISWPLFLFCRFKQFVQGNKNIEIKLKNLFEENLSAADAVYFFGMPKTINNKLNLKLRQELKPGAKIISYSFTLEGWQPAIIDKPTKEDLPIYLYIV